MSNTAYSATRPPPALTFTELIQVIRNGRLADDIADKLTSLIGEVVEHDAKGKLTVTIELVPVLGEDGSRVDVIGQVSTTPPKPKQAGVFFVVDGAGLSRDNPAYAAPLVAADFADRR